MKFIQSIFVLKDLLHWTQNKIGFTVLKLERHDVACLVNLVHLPFVVARLLCGRVKKSLTFSS